MTKMYPTPTLILRWPALSGGHGEEGEEGPQHVVVVELVLLPLPRHGGHLVLIVVQELTSGEERG